MRKKEKRMKGWKRRERKIQISGIELCEKVKQSKIVSLSHPFHSEQIHMMVCLHNSSTFFRTFSFLALNFCFVAFEAEIF